MNHYSVLLKESIDALNIKSDGIYVDGTLGGGGHSEAILKKLTTGHLYAFDQDINAIEIAKKRLASYSNLTIIESNFLYLTVKLQALGITKIDGIVLDLGMSSFQIDEKDRGFSYMQDAPLDMRMNPKSGYSAYQFINEATYETLVKVFTEYGEEPFARPIAKKIIESRPLHTTFDLVRITDSFKYKQKAHSAKQVFQAIRIYVNNELGVLESVLDQIVPLLNPNGAISIITFHSLEDRIVKHFFKKHSEKEFIKGLPVDHQAEPPLYQSSHKPIYPSLQETNENSRSHSAKLRVAYKR